MRIKRPGEFWTNIYTSKEVGVDIDDIPLLPFDPIMEVLEQWVTDGYVYSLNEVSFGYMCFIDPEKKGRSLCFCLSGPQKAGQGWTFLCPLT